MRRLPVIAVFDIGKTNKKLLLFDDHYNLVDESSVKFPEIADENDFPCDNLDQIRQMVFHWLRGLVRHNEWELKAVNFSTYGASLVYIDKDGIPLTPLYNYLKPFPAYLRKKFYDQYGDESSFSLATASPVLGSLNAGLQLYRLKHEQPALLASTMYALHLPQYFSYLLTHQAFSEVTSIGCHTGMWDFTGNTYHRWLRDESLMEKLAPIAPSSHTILSSFAGEFFEVGIGLHDSSAALIPYLVSFREPFALVSTGTWCITLNPYNTAPLTDDELKSDCLSYISYQGTPVKASRLFSGNEHDVQVKRIAAHFMQDPEKYRSLIYDHRVMHALREKADLLRPVSYHEGVLKESLFKNRELDNFDSDEEAYYQLVQDLVQIQVVATKLVTDGTPVRRIFVDGGFSKNQVYMNMLSNAMPDMELYAASMPQATALGAALAIHSSWNTHPLPNDMIELKYFAPSDNPIDQFHT
ncbi:carbohydrate kinase [Flavihumibacter rivuli]|uniref:FGGY-family carbohydrate kinase n=1 Tax=Flavihumibacter rivuli TaxID=2838156 RepID=UPI001BDE6708|nr:FGGY family carbohydrate kinase [Flavihumibacter rivuli]ULQ55333.1 carbohydrate kinase [Flavihumibacter rivuli]